MYENMSLDTETMPRGWRLINTNDGWHIARLGVPGYVAGQYHGNRESADAMHQLYADATDGAVLVPALLKALQECLTDNPGAACYNTGKKTRRLEAINEIARSAIAKANRS